MVRSSGTRGIGGTDGLATHDRVDPVGGIGLADSSVLGSGPARLGWVEEAGAEEAEAEAEKEVVQESAFGAA